MAWFLNGTRIYVEQDSGWQHSPRLGEINVLDSTRTIVHYAGYPSYTRQIVFVMFDGYEENILPLVSGLLSSDITASGVPVLIKNCQPERLFDISRDTAVYRITMSLIKDDS